MSVFAINVQPTDFAEKFREILEENHQKTSSRSPQLALKNTCLQKPKINHEITTDRLVVE